MGVPSAHFWGVKLAVELCGMASSTVVYHPEL